MCDKFFSQFLVARDTRKIANVKRNIRFGAIRGIIINISSLDGSLYPLLYHSSFFCASGSVVRFFSSSWPVLVRYPWKPNRGPSVSLMENRRRRGLEGWPLGWKCRSTFHAQEKILVDVRIIQTTLFVDVDQKLRLLSIKFEALEIAENGTQKISINLINKRRNCEDRISKIEIRNILECEKYLGKKILK